MTDRVAMKPIHLGEPWEAIVAPFGAWFIRKKEGWFGREVELWMTHDTLREIMEAVEEATGRGWNTPISLYEDDDLCDRLGEIANGKAGRDMEDLDLLNLGCGRRPDATAVNMDIVNGPGVDVVWDMEDVPWPFPDRRFHRVVADRSLEHVIRLDPVVREVWRVLEPAGAFHIVVPHGLRSLTDPLHFRAFGRKSFDRFCTEDSDLHSARLFAKERVRYEHAYPFKWHLRQRFGIVDLPIGPRSFIHFDLRRIP